MTEHPTTPGRERIWLCLALLILTAAAFCPALSHDFVGFDDPDYVTANLQVQRGLSWGNVGWAFQTSAAANWHPMTWLSHMLDCQLFGLTPWGHHLTSLLFHGANTVLLFLLLERLTGSLWRSFAVAALFGLHPLHIESVAWVAERKDVLSGLFFMITLLFYVRYAQRGSIGTIAAKRSEDGSTLDYLAALFFFALGLMSKPMLVTLPFILILLDYWPLKRLPASRSGESSLARLVLEKIPFFVLAAVVSYITYLAQQHGGTVSGDVPLAHRLSNAVVSYSRYIGKLLWPSGLAVYYPYPDGWPWPDVLGAGLLLGSGTITALVLRRDRPYFFTGWFWFVGTLVPVIGIVKVGEQAMADRYTYIPSIGFFIFAVWGLSELADWFRITKALKAWIPAALILVCIALTHRQLRYWAGSDSLFRRAIAVTKNNYLALDNLGTALDAKGQTDAAIEQYREALRIKPDFAEAHNNLGASLLRKGELEQAVNEIVQAIRLNPYSAVFHYNLGNVLSEMGRVPEAVTEYQKALLLNPDHVDAHYNLGNGFNRLGRFDDAIIQYREVLRLLPEFPGTHYNLGLVLCRKGKWKEAQLEFQELLKVQPASAEAHMMLGVAFTEQGRLDDAIRELREALRLKPAYPEAQKNLEAVLARQKKEKTAR